MKSAILFVIFLLGPINVFSQTGDSGLRTLPRGLSIPAGTIIDVRLSTSLRTDTYQDGDMIAFEVMQPVVVGGMVVIEKGAFAKGSILKAKRARTFGKGGDLFFSINEVSAVNGSRVPVSLNYRFKGINDHARTNTEIIATGAAIGIPTYGIAAPLALLIGLVRKGNEAEQPAGKLFEVVTRRAFNFGDGELAATPIYDYNSTRGNNFGLPSIFDPSKITITQILNAPRLSDLR
jgi:hypothetical protein